MLHHWQSSELQKVQQHKCMSRSCCSLLAGLQFQEYRIPSALEHGRQGSHEFSSPGSLRIIQVSCASPSACAFPSA
eukprot:1158223-Pelagomonas_calceolata.AAC.8